LKPIVATLILCSINALALGSEAEKVPDAVKIVHWMDRRVHSIKYAKLPKIERFQVNHPHKVVNMNKEIQVFTGSLIRNVLASIGLPIKPDSPITIVAKNGYAVELPYDILLQSEAALATSINGRYMKHEEGSPNLIYTKIGPNHHQLLLQELWVWWVSAVYIGHPKPELKLNEAPADLAGCNGLPKRMISYPRGYRSFATQSAKDKVVEIGGCDLAKLAKVDSDQIVAAEIKTLTGENRIVTVKASDIEIIHSAHRQAIPPALGGPVQICIKKITHDCMYNAQSIDISPIPNLQGELE
jgi:hypothetical protein